MKEAATILYKVAVLLAGSTWTAYALADWAPVNFVDLCTYALMTLMAAGLPVRLPGMRQPVSTVVVFVLIGLTVFSYPEVLAVACLTTLVQQAAQSFFQRGAAWGLFPVASTSLASGAAWWVYRWLAGGADSSPAAGALTGAAAAYFAAETAIDSLLISCEDSTRLRRACKQRYLWLFPYYLISGGAAVLVAAVSRQVGWQAAMLVVPVLYLVYRSYQHHLDHLETEREHAADLAAMHMRTIEALALAVEAKDDVTHDHLRRVQVYAVEIGKELRLSERELKALRAAALLHDIGKLAVPEHIISKPGRLSPEEFEKLKIHTLVGAEIIERVGFPYPVAPVVRSHHEKWDGTGYPDGLRGEEIPIGARILAVVDCLDALSTDRQYRKAMPLDEAVAQIASLAGKSYDPRVVEILQRRYAELEELARAQISLEPSLRKQFRIEPGGSPSNGFEVARTHASADHIDFLASIASARQEAQMFFELSRDLGSSLSLDETLSVLTVRLKRLIPYNTAVFYTQREHVLTPAYVDGENFRVFSSIEIGIGEGLSGWVAANVKPIINGTPAVEPGYEPDPQRPLQCALAVPLEGLNGFLGVLTLYHEDRDAFTSDHLRILRAIVHKVALSIENALKFRQAESSATTDYLTGLPNARSLFLHLDAELSRARRMGYAVTVLVGDLNGFKQINDEFGHLEGNRVLRMVARRLRDACREYDYVARMGGDEFVIVLPGLERGSGRDRVAAFREAVSEAAGEHPLAMSLGQAYYPHDGENAEQLLAEADRRMYSDKVRRKHDEQAALAALEAGAGSLQVQ